MSVVMSSNLSSNVFRHRMQVQYDYSEGMGNETCCQTGAVPFSQTITQDVTL